MKTIALKKIWPALVTRPHARMIFKEAEEENFEVIFDFNGIKLMTSSFADELFAKMIIAGDTNFKIINASDYEKKMIIFVTESRKKHPNIQVI